METWLITGCSSGFGQRLALAAAQRGDRVIATARRCPAPSTARPVGHAIAERKLAAFRSDIDAWRDVTIATDFDRPCAPAPSSV
ncbi:hypothetical protein [Sphingomonas sp. NFR15]|uniref:hypothetical protein n=1 Tax=Sphingomonas sp. NFR15 TaxID=1566282 RepID=UPI000880917B|nr:hypothetical protein [Sphingomonas sp. NFR15]SDA24984.1 hypothetical protein SAMN03159340_01816 [Sphingomonas sp. NFR15]